ncbi:MAG: ureidoglycolate lyase [Christensenellales bacterium]
MIELKAQKLTPKAFAKYGEYVNLLDDESHARNSVLTEGFFPDLSVLNFGIGTLPTISVCSNKKQDKMIVDFLEYHAYTCEGLVALDADVVIYVGVPGANHEMKVENCEAFIVPKGYFVKLEPYIIHGPQFPVDADSAHVICMLPQRTFHNDVVKIIVTDEQKKGIIVL